LRFPRGVGVDDRVLLDCYAVYRLHLKELTDARRSYPALEDEDLSAFETSGNVQLSTTQRNTPEDLNPQYTFQLLLVCT
jgi:hypothetical protein